MYSLIKVCSQPGRWHRTEPTVRPKPMFCNSQLGSHNRLYTPQPRVFVHTQRNPFPTSDTCSLIRPYTLYLLLLTLIGWTGIWTSRRRRFGNWEVGTLASVRLPRILKWRHRWMEGTRGWHIWGRLWTGQIWATVSGICNIQPTMSKRFMKSLLSMHIEITKVHNTYWLPIIHIIDMNG